MATPGKVPNVVVVLFGLNESVAVELLVAMDPINTPLCNVPLWLGGVEFILIASEIPETVEPAPVPVHTTLPKLI